MIKNMKRVLLNGVWNGKCFTENREVDFCFEGNVPGCAHTDLRGFKIPNDIYYRDNSKNCNWIEERDFEYSRCFEVKHITQSVRLVFEGLDVYTDIYLNGKHIGSTDNMFIPHSFEVSKYLLKGENRISVYFHSPIKKIEELPLCDGAFTRERLRTRRIQCTYGWDWVDRFVTCGIFRDVYLEYHDGIEVDNVYVYTENIDSFGAQIYAQLNFAHVDKGEVAFVEIISPQGETVASTRLYVDQKQFVRRFDIPNPQLWYPNGYGDQPLYKLRVLIGNNEFEECFGIRTLKILQLVDNEDCEYYIKAKESQDTAAGKEFDRNKVFSGFQVVVNDKQIFCKGGNWVPCAPFPSEETNDKIINLIQMAKRMGANFLRVWGGGLFEKKAFYDECDRCGILVAQDFLMACGEYPEKEDWFIDALTKESEFATKYLRNHPCLAWYHGDNENTTKGSDIQEDYVGRNSAILGIAPQIYKYDYTRQILPSSPYGGETYASLTCGTSHTTNYLGMIFDYFDSTDCSDYKEYFEQFVSRFISEEGTFGAISRSSMLKFLSKDDLLNDQNQEMLIYHTKTNPHLPKHIFEYVASFAEKALGSFLDAEDRFFKYKYIQYEWVRVAFENVKRNLGYCNGLIFWMFNDCWPAAMGWSFVDYYGLPKASYYSFKRCSKSITASVIRRDAYEIYLSSNESTDKQVQLSVYCIDNNSITTLANIDVIASSNKAVKVFTMDQVNVKDDALIVCDILGDGIYDRAFYKSGLLNLVPSQNIDVIDITDESITIYANGYIHVVELEGEALFDDNYFSLLPYEQRTISYQKTRNTQNDEISAKCYTINNDR